MILKNILKKIIGTGLAAFIAMLVFLPAGAGAQQVDLLGGSKDEACQAVKAGSSAGAGCDQDALDASATKLSDRINKIIDIFSIIVGIAAVIMVIISGFRFVTSGGDSAKVTSARNGIIFALVGVAIVAVAQSLVKFVINKVVT